MTNAFLLADCNSFTFKVKKKKKDHKLVDRLRSEEKTQRTFRKTILIVFLKTLLQVLYSFHFPMLIPRFPFFYLYVRSKASCLTEMSYNLSRTTKPNTLPPYRGADRVKLI